MSVRWWRSCCELPSRTCGQDPRSGAEVLASWEEGSARFHRREGSGARSCWKIPEGRGSVGMHFVAGLQGGQGRGRWLEGHLGRG